jgi:phage repressor protein C with HTH and peptisase S24 domain
MAETRFDAFLKRVYQATGIGSQNELATVLGVNRSAITQARKKNAIPANWTLGLFRAYGFNPDWLETGVGPTFLNPPGAGDPVFEQVPKVRARLCAGDGSFEVGSEIEGYYAFQKKWLHGRGASNQMVLLDIVGNSMEPELRAGDTVLVDRSQKDVLAGAIYAVGIEDTIMVKRLEKHPSKLVLLSDNRDYEPIYLEHRDIHKIRIIGKVIWACREFK